MKLSPPSLPSPNAHREVRRIRQAVPETAARAANPAGHDNFGRSIKMALDSLRDYPLRIYDVKSAQDVKGIGAAVAKVRVFCQESPLFIIIGAHPLSQIYSVMLHGVLLLSTKCR